MKNVPEATDEPESGPSVVRALFLSVVVLAIICALFIEGMEQLDRFFRWLGY